MNWVMLQLDVSSRTCAQKFQNGTLKGSLEDCLERQALFKIRHSQKLEMENYGPDAVFGPHKHLNMTFYAPDDAGMEPKTNSIILPSILYNMIAEKLVPKRVKAIKKLKKNKK